MKEYLDLLKESLMRKEEILKELIKKSETQRQLMEFEEPDWDLFDRTGEEKEKLISELLKQDEGFQSVFDRISEELKANKGKYITEIAGMKAQIKTVTDLSVELEATEQRNKVLIEKKFRENQNKIKQSRLGSQAAIQYYNKMSKINTVDPQLMDKKS